MVGILVRRVRVAAQLKRGPAALDKAGIDPDDVPDGIAGGLMQCPDDGENPTMVAVIADQMQDGEGRTRAQVVAGVALNSWKRNRAHAMSSPACSPKMRSTNSLSPCRR